MPGRKSAMTTNVPPLPEGWEVAESGGEPVALSALNAGLRDLVQTTRDVATAVRSDRAVRRLLVALLVVQIVVFIGFGVALTVATNRSIVTQRENHTLLVTVERVTNPDAVARQQEQTGGLVARIISCVENHQDRLVDRSVPLTAGCPEETLPAPQAPVQPSPMTTTTAPPRTQSTAASRGSSRTEPDWAALRQCESGGDYTTNTGNGYYGAYQFSIDTWRSVGGSGLPSDAPPNEQDARAEVLYARSGAGQWPSCGRLL